MHLSLLILCCFSQAQPTVDPAGSNTVLTTPSRFPSLPIIALFYKLPFRHFKILIVNHQKITKTWTGMRSNIVQLGGETEEVRQEMAEEKPRQETLEKEAGNFPQCWS